MKKLWLTLSVLVALLVIFGITIFERPYDQRYGCELMSNDCYDHATWIYDRIHLNPHPVDIAFIGSSRTIHGIQDSAMTKAMNDSVWTENFGYCRFGRNMDYETLKELTESKTLKVAVIEVREEEDYGSHIDFPYRADSKDILQPVPFNQKYFTDVWTGFEARLSFLKSELHLQSFVAQPVRGANFGYGSSDDELAGTYPFRFPDTVKNNFLLNQMVHWFNLQYPENYLYKISSLAESHHIRLFFLYLPGFHQWTLPAELPLYEKLGYVLIPPEEIFTDRRNFIDPDHLNDRGSGMLSKWLQSQLSTRK